MDSPKFDPFPCLLLPVDHFIAYNTVNISTCLIHFVAFLFHQHLSVIPFSLIFTLLSSFIIHLYPPIVHICKQMRDTNLFTRVYLNTIVSRKKRNTITFNLKVFTSLSPNSVLVLIKIINIF
uniref:Uncharacterized protein n=1 Tax=Tetranychus urticae TaxID=32264 RepID=T1JY75_TETUR